jgi:HlyD family secretion protein
MKKKSQSVASRHGVKIALILAVVLGLGLAVYKKSTQGVPVKVVKVSQSSISAYVEERAHTSLPNKFLITMPMQGRIEPILVREGDLVTEGQVVATLEDLDWKDATSQMDDLVTAMVSTVAATAAEIKASQVRADYTQWLWKAHEGNKGVSKRDQQQAKWQYLDSVVKTEESKAAHHSMSALLSATRIMQPFLRRTLDRTSVKSPVAGVVLKRHVWNEQVMQAGQPLLDIGDLSQLEVTAEILSGEATRIQQGDRVEIFGEAVGDISIMGTVRRVEPEAFTKLSSLGVEQQRVNVRITFDPDALANYKSSGRSLGLGYRARVRVITDQKDQAMVVPRTAAFRSKGGKWAVYRINGDVAQLVPVTVGLSNDLQVEILSGLTAGDLLVDAPETNIVDGVRLELSDEM